MELDNNLLKQFSKAIDTTKDELPNSNVYYGTVIDPDSENPDERVILEEDYCLVRPNANGDETVEKVNCVQCKQNGKSVKIGDTVKYRVDNGDAEIVENITTPGGNDVVVIHLDSIDLDWEMWHDGSHSGGIRYESGENEDLKEYVQNKEYRIMGISSIYLSVKVDNDYIRMDKVNPETQEYILTLLANISLISYSIESSTVTACYSMRQTCDGYTFRIGMDIALVKASSYTHIPPIGE